MIVPFHSMSRQERREFYAIKSNRQLRRKIIEDGYEVKTDMENLVLNIVELHADISDCDDIEDILGYVSVCGGYESFDVLFEKYDC